MSKPSPFEDMHFNLIARKPAAAERPQPDAPFRILVMGDFSGRANRGLDGPPADPVPMAIDCDNLDQVMARLGVALRVPVSKDCEGVVEVRFEQMDDFHPDQVYHHAVLFQALKNTRQDLMNPATFETAAQEVRGWAQGSDEATGSGGLGAASGQVPWEAATATDNTFDELLGKPAALPDVKPQQRTSAPIAALLRHVVAPHVVHTDPHREQLVNAVDEATSVQMRGILHHPDFQNLEAAWRALDFLVRHLETDDGLKVYLVDMTKAQLSADLASADSLESTAVYRLLYEQAAGAPGGQPWAVVVGDYTFDATVHDAQTLARLAAVGAHAGSPFLAAASPHLLGCRSLVLTPAVSNWNEAIDPEAKAAWDALRQLRQATYVGLALPRFLLRLPYGAATDPIDSFAFEEIQGHPQHGDYLWGNPAFVCAYLLGQDYSQEGWALTPGAGLDIEDLPAHTFKLEGESKMTPCAEAWLTDDSAQEIINRGLMPLMSIRGRDAVRLARFQSIADPVKNVAGRWVG